MNDTPTRITPEWSARMAALEPEGCEIGAGELAMLPGLNTHLLYKTSDADAPDCIKDRNGEVVLGLCRVCGKGESELSGPCTPTVTCPLPEQYPSFPDITRLLEQDVVLTEKIDGTNGLIYIDAALNVHAGSRDRWLSPVPQNDNYGFAAWVKENERELRLKLGMGMHYGEWWGHKLQRNYGMSQRVFSLFNTKRWADPEVRPSCCDVVPVVFTGPLHEAMAYLDASRAAWLAGEKVSEAAAKYGVTFKNPEGHMAMFTKRRQYFKVPYKMGPKGMDRGEK